MTVRHVAAFDALLDREYDALMSGRLSDLAGCFAEKQRLLPKLQAARRETVEGIKRKMERNQNLMKSAMQGIRDVQDRIAALKTVRNSLQTYDTQGQRKTVAATDAKRFEHRL